MTHDEVWVRPGGESMRVEGRADLDEGPVINGEQSSMTNSGEG